MAKQNAQTKKSKPTSAFTAEHHHTPYTETDIHGPPFTQPPPDQIEGHQEFEIEAIVSHKGNGNRRRFLVKWTGYPSSENQWLPKTELSHAAKILKTYKKLKNL
ncbi:hypothetical protein M0805_006796 [Coniferiporia weirii]|nr:hypothetical protein M0805_006796 [Coniferiporia weirii]